MSLLHKAGRALLVAGALYLLFFSSLLSAQNAMQRSSTRIMVYNVENLFDTINDPNKDDESFLPTGEMQWDEKKYRSKVRHVAQVISDIGEWSMPGLIGLCEVESALAVQDLLKQKPLRSTPYDFTITQGADERGIDVALLWDTRFYTLQQARAVPSYATEGAELTCSLLEPAPIGSGRSALWATLRFLPTGELIDVLVAHFPSRRSGTRATAPKRKKAAQQLRRLIDQIQATDPLRYVVVMGDFNDNPESASIREVMQTVAPPATLDEVQPTSLYNLSRLHSAAHAGTHRHDGGYWNPDQIIVSGSLLSGRNSLCTRTMSVSIFAPEYISTRQGAPKRSFYGTTYTAGYSDHYPIYIDLLY